jgi:inner membrane protein
MPTVMTHGFVAALLGKTFVARRMEARFWLFSVLCSILPDADVIGFSFGVRYEDMLGHRGLSHSLFFALAASLAVTFLGFSPPPRRRSSLRLLCYFFAVTTGVPTFVG